MTVYSYSRINTYQNCPYQFKLQYLDKIKIEEEGVEAFMGSRVHETLEKLYKEFILGKINSVDELVDHYKQQWDAFWHDKVMVVKKNMSAEDYKNAGEMAIRDYYDHYYPFDKTKPLWTEEKRIFKLGDDEYKMLGIIDRLDKRKDGTLEIHDYKSSGKLPTQDNVDSDKQLALYQLAVADAFPNVDKIELVWHYVLFDTELRSKRTKEQLEELKKEYRRLIDEIENAQDYPTNVSRLCDWCGYQEYCPAKRHFLKIEDFDQDNQQMITEEGYMLVDRYAALLEKDKELREKIDELKESLILYANQNELEVIRGTLKQVKISSYTEDSFPTISSNLDNYNKLEQLVRELGLWDKVTSINTKQILKIIKENDLPAKSIKKLKKFIIQVERNRVSLADLKLESDE